MTVMVNDRGQMAICHGFEFGNASLGMRRIGDKCFVRLQPFHGLLFAPLGAPRQIYSIKQIGGCAARLFRAWPEMSRGEARSHHMYVMGHGKGSPADMRVAGSTMGYRAIS